MDARSALKTLPLVCLTLLATVATPTCTEAQKKTGKSSTELFPLFDVLDAQSYLRERWELAYSRENSHYKPQLATGVVDDFKLLEALHLGEGKDPAAFSTPAEFELGRKYHGELVALLDGLKLIGDKLGQFLYSPGISTPIHFVLKDGGLTLLVSGVACDFTLNTLRATGRERAATVINGSILPSIPKFARAFPISAVKYFGMFVFYGSKDFSSNDLGSQKCEGVALVASSKNCRQFASGEMTEDDFLSNADIYLSDRDMVTGVKKVKISVK